MQMSGEQRIPAPRAQVWAALNDPEVLKASIPGCESLEPVGADGYTATVTTKVGPVKARFTGQVTLSDIDPPNGYTISGEGKGGAAGFARGGAKVKLADDGDGTLMTYEVDANVGGKLAQLGSRLIDGTARKLADEFFVKFSELAAQAPAAAPEPAPAAAAPEPAPEPAAAPTPEPAPAPKPAAPPPPMPSSSTGLPTWVWGVGVIVLIALGIYLFAF
jgi:carbon monoxide dehydrogenase subunit G